MHSKCVGTVMPDLKACLEVAPGAVPVVNLANTLLEEPVLYLRGTGVEVACAHTVRVQVLVALGASRASYARGPSGRKGVLEC